MKRLGGPLLGFPYRLRGPAGEDLGLILHVAPNLEPGDGVSTKDGRRWKVTRYVAGREEHVIRLLEVDLDASANQG